MKPLQYIISTNGLGIAVGIIADKQRAEEFATLAENIFGWNHNDDLFDRLLFCPSENAFRKLLILNEYFKIWDEHWTRNRVAKIRDKAKVVSFTKRAIRRANLIMSGNVTWEPFMQQRSSRNVEYIIGEY